MIGVDFDNTIARYDDAFPEAAVARGLVAPSPDWTKTSLRDHLRRIGREDDWTELQGQIYGPMIGLADPFDGVLTFFETASSGNADIAIVSHKTKTPYRGEPHDLHAAARGWLEAKGFHAEPVNLPKDKVHLEETRDAKYARIAALKCRVFIDDLPEFLGDNGFPEGPEPLLFDPNDHHTDERRFRRFSRWADIARYIFDG